MVKDIDQEAELEQEEIEKKVKKPKKPKAKAQEESARVGDADQHQPSTIFYLHSLLLFGGRMMHRVLGFYNSLFDLTPTDKARIYRNISHHYGNKGLNDKALDYLKEWAKLEATNPDPHYQLGIALAASGDYKRAMRSYEAALKLNPNHKGAIYRKSSLCVKLKDYKGAVEGLDQLIKMDPDNAKAHYLMGISFDRMDEVDKAIEALQKAAELDPEEIKYHQHLGFLYERKEDHKQAARCFSKVMELQREQEDDDE
jgi:tetratricopeptide (TPR) repeat protein